MEKKKILISVILHHPVHKGLIAHFSTLHYTSAYTALHFRALQYTAGALQYTARALQNTLQ